MSWSARSSPSRRGARSHACRRCDRRMRCFASTSSAATTASGLERPGAGDGRESSRAGDKRGPRAARLRAALPPSAGPAAAQDACPPEAIGAVCGDVDVPLESRHRGGATIAIAFELYPHTDPGPAESAIIVNFGGPGASTAAVRGFVPFWLGPSFARHDVLLIDDRGRGLSGAIDCPDFQHGIGSLLDGVRECASQLGATATDYSTADIAADDEAVRVALGYNLVDFAGTSTAASMPRRTRRASPGICARCCSTLRSACRRLTQSPPRRAVHAGTSR